MTTRRDFLRTGTGAGLGAVVGLDRLAIPAPPVVRRPVARPVCVASGNGVAAVSRALDELDAGATTVEAVVRGVNLVEEDPTDTSVGYGGLPNLDGVVQLDSSVMHGPTRGAGAVAALEGIKRPSLVALDVMRYTDHHLLVGEGARRFAESMGHPVEELLTEASRRRWIEWRARMSDGDEYLMPSESGERLESFREPEASPIRRSAGFGGRVRSGASTRGRRAASAWSTPKGSRQKASKARRKSSRCSGPPRIASAVFSWLDCANRS